MFLKELLKYIGIDLNGGIGGGIVPIEGVDVNFILYNFSLMVLIFSIISLLSVFNLILYFFIIKYYETNFVLELINKWGLFGKFIKYYKKSRLSLIVIEFLFLVFSSGGMVYISFIVFTKCFV